MKERLTETFDNKIDWQETNESVIYIVDYTERTKSAQAVELHNRKPDNIDVLKIYNPNALYVSCGIFGKQALIDASGKDMKHCECVLFPSATAHDTWVLFVEIKDCKAKNISEFFADAKKQIITTVEYFREQNLISLNKRVHAVISFPRKNKSTFHNQLVKTNERKYFFDKHRIILKGTNTITIKSNTSLS